MSTLVIYDIVEEKVRRRIAEVCKDYGLERIQYSAFFGMTDRAVFAEDLAGTASSCFERATDGVGHQAVCVLPATHLFQLRRSAAPREDSEDGGGFAVPRRVLGTRVETNICEVRT
ncbi:MAG TPA: CRISPR-associated endonuclease Cas2 [Firmicutes bacterium]|nr:CRISPR-associated endonuclease Cas2 [Candidatus Fermentithermobacillaceae bacterium]